MIKMLQVVALYFYFICCISAGIIWFLFTPTLAVPANICHFQGKYFLAPSIKGRTRWSGSLNAIRLTFSEYLQNSVMKGLQQVVIYDARIEEAN